MKLETRINPNGVKEGEEMKNPVIKGTFKLKLPPIYLQTKIDAGQTDTTIIHEILDVLLTQLVPIAQKYLSFHDCEIVEDKEEKECKIPF